MNIYSLSNTDINNVYDKIFSYALKNNLKLLFIVRDENEISLEFKKQVLGQKESAEPVKHWPGTITKENDIVLYRFNLSDQLINSIYAFLPRLWDWQSPQYPEDPSMVRKNGVPLFISTCHERDYYFLLDETEVVDIEKYFQTKLLLEKENVSSPTFL